MSLKKYSRLRPPAMQNAPCFAGHVRRQQAGDVRANFSLYEWSDDDEAILTIPAGSADNDCE
jgi:hypothetical protein